MLRNKVIFVVGASGLLGKRICRAILSNGGHLVLADLDISNTEKLKLELNAEFPSGKLFATTIDITSKDSIQKSMQETKATFTKIDALVNAAYPRNKNYGRHFFDVEYEDFCENVSVHLGGYFLTSQQFAKYFAETGCGNIINISSVYGVIAPKFEIYKDTPMTMPVEYAAIKSALIHLTKYMAKYLKDKSNCLSKGMLDPEDIMGALVFLLSDASKFINGQNIIVDDGFTL